MATSDPRVAYLYSGETTQTCPVIACHMGEGALVYRALVVGPDGRQRAVAGCVKHIALQVAQAVSEIRVEPFE